MFQPNEIFRAHSARRAFEGSKGLVDKRRVEAPGQLLAAIWNYADAMSDGKSSDKVPDVETLVPGAPGCERFGAGDATWQS